MNLIQHGRRTELWASHVKMKNIELKIHQWGTSPLQCSSLLPFPPNLFYQPFDKNATIIGKIVFKKVNLKLSSDVT